MIAHASFFQKLSVRIKNITIKPSTVSAWPSSSTLIPILMKLSNVFILITWHKVKLLKKSTPDRVCHHPFTFLGFFVSRGILALKPIFSPILLSMGLSLLSLLASSITTMISTFSETVVPVLDMWHFLKLISWVLENGPITLALCSGHCKVMPLGTNRLECLFITLNRNGHVQELVQLLVWYTFSQILSSCVKCSGYLLQIYWGLAWIWLMFVHNAM